MKGGLILESPKFKDFSCEKVFGAAPFLDEIKPLNRDISNIPIVYQGDENTCVSATITWIRQWMDKNKPDLSHEWLAEISRTGVNGAKPSQVLEPARKTGILPQNVWDSVITFSFEYQMNIAANFRIPNYFYIRDLSRNGIYHKLQKSVLAIGVKDWKGVGPHFMAAYDVTDDRQSLKCVNWWGPNEQNLEIVPFEKVVIAITFDVLPDGMNKKEARLSFFEVLFHKFQFLLQKYVI